jgi:hypothetical protein
VAPDELGVDRVQASQVRAPQWLRQIFFPTNRNAFGLSVVTDGPKAFRKKMDVTSSDDRNVRKLTESSVAIYGELGDAWGILILRI